MRWTRSARPALVALLIFGMTLAGCGGDASGPNDDDVFGTYTLRRANGESLPALTREINAGFGAGITTYAESGSFRISEDGTWAFSMHFSQLAIDDEENLSRIEYDSEDSGSYTLQRDIITLDGIKAVPLDSGVLTYTVDYIALPGSPATTVHFEFEK